MHHPVTPPIIGFPLGEAVNRRRSSAAVRCLLLSSFIIFTFRGFPWQLESEATVISLLAKEILQTTVSNSFSKNLFHSGAEGTRFKRRSADKRVLSPPDMEVKIITADPRVNRSWNLLLLSWLHILVTPLHEPPFSLLSSGAV